MPKFKKNQSGVISPLLIIIIICLVGVWFFVGQTKLNTKNTSVKQADVNTSQVDKKEKDWMEKYCQQELHKLPKPPFKYSEVRDPANMSESSSAWIIKEVPQEKRVFHSKDCSIEYRYDEKVAFPSVGVKYSFDIKQTNKFEQTVEELLTPKFDSSWKKISPLNQKDTGNPSYSYQGFPMVFRRENSQLGTIEFASADFVAAGILIDFYLAEK